MFSSFLFISSLTYQLFKSRLLYFHLFVSFPNFSVLLISNFFPLWLEKTLSIIFILLNLLRLFYCLECGLSWRIFPYALEKNVYSAVVWWNVLLIRVRFIWFIVLSVLFLVDLCLIVLFIIETGVLKFLTIIVELFLSSLLSVLLHVFFCALFSTYIGNGYIFLMD